MAQSETLPLKAIKGLAVIGSDGDYPGTLGTNNESNTILVQNENTGLIEHTTVESIVARGGGGGGTQDLDSVLSEGNVSELPVIIQDANYAVEHNTGGMKWTEQGSGFTAELITREPVVNGSQFALPAVTTVQLFTLPVTVGQVEANDGGDIQYGLQELINVNGYAEALDGSYVSLNPSGNTGFASIETDSETASSISTQSGIVKFNSSNPEILESTEIRGELGLIKIGIVGGGGGDFGGFLFDSDYTATMTTDRHIPDIGKVNSLIAAASVGGTDLGYIPSPTNGTVTSDTGDDAVLPLATGTNAGLLAPADFTKLSNLASNANATYAPLASPAFTGNPTAPTPSAGDNDTSIATTAFVTAANAALLIPRNIVVDVTDSTTVTGTTTETLVKSYLVNGGTLTTGVLETIITSTKTGSSGTSTIKVYFNTTNTLSGATQIAAAVSGAASQHVPLMRNFAIKADNTINGFPFATTSPTDGVNSNGYGSTSFNPTNTYYFLVSLTNAASGDSGTIKNVQFKFNKTT